MKEKSQFSYKGAKVNIFGLPASKKFKDENKAKKRKYLYSFNFTLPKNTPKNLLIIYDIPECRKKERDWFRRQLKNFDFIMIQRSVWVGPAPLSLEFLAYVKKIGLQKEFKTFKLAKAYI